MIAKALRRAAAYIRMSSDRQERSPAEQKADLEKLAAKEGYRIDKGNWYSDEGVHGDSGTDERPGLAAMLKAAEKGEFSAVLAWHTNRLSRQDPMDAVENYNRLRKAGVEVVTVAEGRIDLQDFSRQLLVFVGQKANHDFLRELSQKALRGKVANAKAGGYNGGPCRYGLQRVLVDSSGKVLRVLSPGETVKQAGCRVVLRPGTDKAKLAAVRFAFDRFSSATLSIWRLAIELQHKGYPPPRGKRWTWGAVRGILGCPWYAGHSSWGAVAQGRYFQASGDNVEPVPNGNGKVHWRRKDPSEAITVQGAGKPLVPVATFQKVQRKLARAERGWRCKARPYPLSGLLYCSHCGLPMHGHTATGRDRSGRVAYWYPRYTCQSYIEEGAGNAAGCGHQVIDAERVLRWIIRALQEEVCGPGRAEIVQHVKDELRATTATVGDDKGRLTARLAELDREVGRLVRAIRQTDAPELLAELTTARQERNAVACELDRVGRITSPQDIDKEAERVADSLLGLEARLAKADPAELREVLDLVVEKITCRWSRVVLPNGKTRCPLEYGDVVLRDFGQALGRLSGSAGYVTTYSDLRDRRPRVLRFTAADLAAA